MIANFDEVLAALKDKNLREAKERATRIADKVVPKYRTTYRYYSCTSHTAQLWQAAWDGAMEAMGYDNEQFKCFPSLQAE